MHNGIQQKNTGYAPKYTLDFLKGMRREDIEKKNSHFFQNENSKLDGGEGGIRTLAPVSRPTPLAGAPLRPA